MSSVVQHNRRGGSSKRGSSAEEASRMNQPPDLRQVTVLSKSDWQRIQNEVNQVNVEDERLREAAKQREALQLRSKEVAKLWPNSIANQREKKLQAKKIREEIEEEKRKRIDEEEARYQEQQRKDAIDKAHTQLYYQTDRVRGLHGALLLTEVLKEREAQIELKQRMEGASKDADKEFLDKAKTREAEALRQEQEKALQKKFATLAIAEDQKKQAEEHEMVREKQRLEKEKDGEKIRHLQDLHQLEQRMEEEKQAELRRDLFNAHLENISNRDLMKAQDAQKQEAEEEQRKLYLSAKEKMIKLRKDKEKELLREKQMRRDWIMNKLTIEKQDQTEKEMQRRAKAVAEKEAKQARQQREEEEKRAAAMESIVAHRELMRQEKEQRDKTAAQQRQDAIQASEEAGRIFSEKQQLKSQRMKEDEIKLQEFHVSQMAEKSAKHQQLRKKEEEVEVKNAEIIAEEEKVFEQYSQQLIRGAAETQRNVIPLSKAAMKGIGGGVGPIPISGGAKPNYLVLDRTDAQMPNYVSSTTRTIKKLHEAADIQDGKQRLGFTWL